MATSRMSRAPFYWPSASPAREISAMTNSAPMRPMESQLQQKKASFSAGIEPQWQPKKAAFSVDQQHQTWGKELENEASRRDKGTSSGLDEECKEFVRMFREKLQEFAMILSKKYHYNFPVEYFDDYHGSFNKEEFLKIEKPKEEKSEEKELEEGNQSIDNLSSTLTSAKTLGQVSIIEQSLDGSEVAASPDVNAHKQPWYEYSRKEYKPPLLHFEAVVDIFAAEHGCGLNGDTITTTMAVDLSSLFVLDGNEVFPIEILGQFILGIDLENLRMKKKRPRSRKKEKRIIRIENDGIE